METKKITSDFSISVRISTVSVFWDPDSEVSRIKLFFRSWIDSFLKGVVNIKK